MLAAQRDLAGVALTDHDTFDGLEEAAAKASELGLDFVPGIEFSAEYDGASLHILGYWVDPADAAIEAELLRLTATRFRRGEMIVEKLRELGFDISIERVRELAGGDAIARPHIAEAMVEAGIVADEKEAFDRYISDDGSRLRPQARAAADGCAPADRRGRRRVRARASRDVARERDAFPTSSSRRWRREGWWASRSAIPTTTR